MAIQKSEALVLKNTKFRETSLITTFFTAEFGKIRALSKGVRKEKSAVISYYEPFTHVEIVFYEKTHSDIHFLSECSLVYFFPRIRSHFERISWASYVVDLADAVLPEKEKDYRLFSLLLEILHRMELEDPSRLACVFEVKLFQHSGLSPNLYGCVRCGRKGADGYLYFQEGGILCEFCRGRQVADMFLSKGLIRTIIFLTENDSAKSSQLRISREMEDEIHRLTYRWLRYRLDKELASAQFLHQEELLSSL
jgi:DNA repair protein RecO (recombination protein O)